MGRDPAALTQLLFVGYSFPSSLTCIKLVYPTQTTHADDEGIVTSMSMR